MVKGNDIGSTGAESPSVEQEMTYAPTYLQPTVKEAEQQVIEQAPAAAEDIQSSNDTHSKEFDKLMPLIPSSIEVMESEGLIPIPEVTLENEQGLNNKQQEDELSMPTENTLVEILPADTETLIAQAEQQEKLEALEDLTDAEMLPEKGRQNEAVVRDKTIEDGVITEDPDSDPVEDTGKSTETRPPFAKPEAHSVSDILQRLTDDSALKEDKLLLKVPFQKPWC